MIDKLNKLTDRDKIFIDLSGFITFLSFNAILHRVKDNDILKYLVNISAKTYFCQIVTFNIDTNFVPKFKS